MLNEIKSDVKYIKSLLYEILDIIEQRDTEEEPQVA